jgi:poly(hydroxyalkanoate) granule-associated protein
MAKKRIAVEDLQKNMKDSAQKIWLAGLGALATAEEEGGKLFKNLVKKGEAYESKAKGKLEGLRGQVEVVAGKAKQGATGAWDKVEEAWDDKVAGTLRRIGVPSKEEIHHLSKRVEELTAMVESKARGARARGARARATARKKATPTRRTR